MANEAPLKMNLSVQRHGAEVHADGKLFARYLVRSGSRPIVWPLIGPTGVEMTRAYPMEKGRQNENSDHPHHRSLWFGLMGINDVDFWHESSADDKSKGEVVHREFLRSDCDGEVATLITSNDYLDPNGNRVAQDERTLRFGATEDVRWIDVAIKLWSKEGPLTLADTKEGALGLRVPGWMKLDAGLDGRIENSNSLTDQAAWGIPAAWCDYTGERDGQRLGVAILAHPSSYKPEPRWHVRSYGLFAMNPFGEADFGGEPTGGLQLDAREAVQVRGMIVLHKGDAAAADLAGWYDRYKTAP